MGAGKTGGKRNRYPQQRGFEKTSEKKNIQGLPGWSTVGKTGVEENRRGKLKKDALG